MSIPTEGVHYDKKRRKHVIVLVMDADEARNFAAGLHHGDAGRQEVEMWADEAEKKDEEAANDPLPGIGVVVTLDRGPSYGCTLRSPRW